MLAKCHRFTNNFLPAQFLLGHLAGEHIRLALSPRVSFVSANNPRGGLRVASDLVEMDFRENVLRFPATHPNLD
jgi:hypothetical protein